MLKLHLAEGLVGVSGVSIPIGNSKESKESPGSTWPKDIIALEPGETAGDVVLKKIKELSDSDCRDAFMVADLDVLASRHQVFRQALPRVSPFYVVKCNSSPWMLRVLAALGTSFDCSSQGELEQVLDLGVAPSRIVYANPCKPVSHIRFASLHGVKLLVFNSEEELIKVAQHHPGARLVLWWTQDSDSIFPLSSKFGARLEVCEHLLKSARDLGLAVVGTSFHVGSRCQTPRNFMKAIVDCWRVFEMGSRIGHDMSLLDIRGGFSGEEGSDPEFEEVAGVINAALAQDFPEGSGVEVIAEPGCFCATFVCMTAVNIIAKKAVLEPRGRRKLLYYLNDGHYGTFRIFPRESEPRMPIMVKELSPKLSLFPCTLFGPTCDAFDKLFLKEVQLPELDVGDWLVFPFMGAYTSVLSSTFNGSSPTSICYALGPELRSLLETTPWARHGQNGGAVSPWCAHPCKEQMASSCPKLGTPPPPNLPLSAQAPRPHREAHRAVLPRVSRPLNVSTSVGAGPLRERLPPETRQGDAELRVPVGSPQTCSPRKQGRAVPGGARESLLPATSDP
nr:PREDICTED: antizyme inhibitor 2 [Bos mutus]